MCLILSRGPSIRPTNFSAHRIGSKPTELRVTVHVHRCLNASVDALRVPGTALSQPRFRELLPPATANESRTAGSRSAGNELSLWRKQTIFRWATSSTYASKNRDVLRTSAQSRLNRQVLAGGTLDEPPYSPSLAGASFIRRFSVA